MASSAVRRIGDGSALVRGAARFVIFAGVVGLAGCSLPKPDGTEAALLARVEKLPALERASGKSATAVARNGLLLDPAVREAASRVAASADDIRIQRAALFPSLGLTIGAGIDSAGVDAPTIALNAKQLVLDFGNTERAISEADFDMQINYLEFQKTVDETVVDALESYSDVAVQARLVEVRQAQLSSMRELQRLVARRYELGATTHLDVLETQRRVEAAAFLVEDARLALAEAQDTLVRLSGQNEGGAIPSNLTSHCGETVDVLETRIAQLRLARSVVAWERAEHARLPQVYISPSARVQAGDGAPDLGVSIGVQSDLLQGGALSANARQAATRVEGAAAGVEAAALDAQLAAIRLTRDIGAAERKAALIGRQLAIFDETRALYRKQYFELGSRQISELLDNETDYFDLRADQVELQSDLDAANLECSSRANKLREGLSLTEQALYDLPLDI